MAELWKSLIFQAQENLTENASNATTKNPATPEGTVFAYSSIILMAILPIYFGSYRAVKYHKDNKAEKMTTRDAAIFPLTASCALFTLYLVFKFFSKEYVNLLLTGYFFILGVLALTHILSPILSNFIPRSLPKIPFHLLFKQGEGDDEANNLIDFKFTTHDIVACVVSIVVGGWYLWTKHWVANNLFGMAFAINAVEILHLNSVITGCILLSGLFFYDIFWVFGTDVMVTVAMSFEAPIKVVFPQDLLTHGIYANNFTMMGLGDIVIPGIFIALLLRFDFSLKRKSHVYFNATCVAYFVGLVTTQVIMYTFKHAQPALLYLVPACMFTPFLIALVKGEVSRLYKYEDSTEEPKKKSSDETKKNSSDEAKKTNSSSVKSKKKEEKKSK